MLGEVQSENFKYQILCFDKCSFKKTCIWDKTFLFLVFCCKTCTAEAWTRQSLCHCYGIGHVCETFLAKSAHDVFFTSSFSSKKTLNSLPTSSEFTQKTNNKGHFESRFVGTRNSSTLCWVFGACGYRLGFWAEEKWALLLKPMYHCNYKYNLEKSWKKRRSGTSVTAWFGSPITLVPLCLFFVNEQACPYWQCQAVARFKAGFSLFADCVEEAAVYPLLLLVQQPRLDDIHRLCLVSIRLQLHVPFSL